MRPLGQGEGVQRVLEVVQGARQELVPVMHDVQLARLCRQVVVEHGQLSLGDQVADHPVRQATDAQTGGDHALDRFGAADPPGVVQVAQVRRQPVGDFLGGARTGFAHQPGCASQGLSGHWMCLCQGVVCGGDDHQFVFEPGAHTQLGQVAGALDQAKVDGQLGGLAGDVGAVADDHLDAHARVMPGMRLHQDRHEVAADGGAAADGEPRDPVVAFESLFDLRRGLQQAYSLRQQGLAVGIEHQPLADPVEQARFEGAFQFLKRRAGGGLGQRQRRTGIDGRAMLGDGPEDVELTQGQAHRSTD